MPPKKTARAPAPRAARPKPAAKPGTGGARPDERPRVGEAAPDVRLVDHEGKEFHLSDFRGRSLVLYFYPKDFTGGCTTQLCDFGAMLPDFEGIEADVVGVSPDDSESHAKFRAKHRSGVRLATGDAEVLGAFGVWKEKSMYGRKYMGVERSTFLIGPDGTVAGAWRKVQPDGHAAAVLEAVRGLAEK